MLERREREKHPPSDDKANWPFLFPLFNLFIHLIEIDLFNGVEKVKVTKTIRPEA